MTSPDVDSPRRPPAASTLRSLHHDLLSALGAVSITLETLQVLEERDEPVDPAKRGAMIERALTALREAERMATELGRRARGEGG